jgi:hypothetical protein
MCAANERIFIPTISAILGPLEYDKVQVDGKIAKFLRKLGS